MSSRMRGALICAAVMGALCVALLFGVSRRSPPDLAPGSAPARPALETETPASEPAPPADPAGSATIVASLQSSERGPVTLRVVPKEAAPASILCAARARSLALASVDAPRTGTVTLEVPSGRALLLLAGAPGEELARWSAPLPILAPGSSTRVSIPFPSAPSILYGLVLDRDSSRPLEGVEITASDAREALPCLSATTRPDGTFTLPNSPLARSLRATARAPGHAPVDFALGRDFSDPRDPLTLQLPGGGALVVSVRRPGGAPVPDIGIQVGTSTSFPGEGFRIQDRSARTDATGRCELLDLPSQSGLELTLYREGRVLRREPNVQALRPGERRELAIELDGARVRGRVVDESGKPVPDIHVGIRSVSPARSVGWGSSDDLTAEVSADSDGRFRFDDIPSGRWQIGPVESASRPLDVARVPIPVQIAAGARELDVTLVVYRGLFISGEVVDAVGRPVRDRLVYADSGSLDMPSQARAQSDASGRFTLGPLAPLDYYVGAGPPGPVKAHAGDVGVVLRLQPGSSVEGVVIDSQTGLPVVAQVTATRGKAAAYRIVVRSGSDGVFSFDELPPGRWRIDAETPTQRARTPELVLQGGEALRNVDLRLEKGAILYVVSKVPHARLTVVDAQGETVCADQARPSVWRCVAEPGTLVVSEQDLASATKREVQVSLRADEQRRIDFSQMPR